MTTQTPDDVVGPEHFVLVTNTQAVQSGNQANGVSYVRADLYDKLKEERDRYLDAITEAARSMGIMCRREPLSDPGFTGVLINLREALNPQEHGGGE